MAGTTGTFGWLRSVSGLPTMPDMVLASVQGSPEVSAYAADGYLLEIYRQVAETTPPTATPRYARLAAFLAFVGLVTATLAVMVSLPEGSSSPLIPTLCIVLGAIGLVVSVAFYALEIRARRAFEITVDPDAADTTSSIYLASTGFFTFTIAMAGALILIR